MSAVLRDAESEVALTNVELDQLVRSISYKHGYRLVFVSARDLRWELTVPDSYGKYHELTVVNQSFNIPHDMDKDTAIRLIFAFLAYHEDHEMREAFMVNGKRPFNPHRKGTSITIDHHMNVPHGRVHFDYDGDDLR